MTTTATAASPVGTYPITASGAAGPNYTITYAGGTLTVNRPRLTINRREHEQALRRGGAGPDRQLQRFGQWGHGQQPDYTADLTTTATAASPVGTYPITASGAASPITHYLCQRHADRERGRA